VRSDLVADAALVAGILVTFVALRRRRWWGAAPLLVTLLGIYARYVEPFWLETTRTRMAWGGPPLKVVVLSDVHVGRTGPWKVREAVRRAMEARPDLILIAGDFISAWELDERRAQLLGELDPLAAPLGVFAVLGNHDTEPWGGRVPRAAAITRRLGELGIVVLRNQSRALAPGVTLVGLGDFEAKDTRHEAAFAGVAGPTIVLTHNWKSLQGAPRFDVAFAGHTHGGQMCLPLTDWCPFTWTRFGPYMRGLFAWPAGGQLYVTRGVGESLFRARLTRRPEVTVIELVSAP
jgi:predicted MPP superfamily phosphohydrolase